MKDKIRGFVGLMLFMLVAIVAVGAVMTDGCDTNIPGYGTSCYAYTGGNGYTNIQWYATITNNGHPNYVHIDYNCPFDTNVIWNAYYGAEGSGGSWTIFDGSTSIGWMNGYWDYDGYLTNSQYSWDSEVGCTNLGHGVSN